MRSKGKVFDLRQDKKIFERIARLLLKYHTEDLAVPVETLEQAAAEGARVLKELLDQPILPHPDERLAVTLETPKTAALFFDRVWYPLIAGPIPPDIIIYGATEFEIWSQAILLGIDRDKWDWGKVFKLVRKTPISKFWGAKLPAARRIAEDLFERNGCIATPVYESMGSLNME